MRSKTSSGVTSADPSAPTPRNQDTGLIVPAQADFQGADKDVGGVIKVTLPAAPPPQYIYHVIIPPLKNTPHLRPLKRSFYLYAHVTIIPSDKGWKGSLRTDQLL